jgi:hypothetical protein
MTAPVDPTVKLGPGTLTFGETATAIDVSCLVNSFTIVATKDQGDSVTKLCGTVKTGVITYTYQGTGNLDTDVADPDGLFALSQLSPGTEVPFSFCPNTEGAPTATGTVILDPLDFGGEEYGAILASDLALDLVGAPTYTWPIAADPAA